MALDTGFLGCDLGLFRGLLLDLALLRGILLPLTKLLAVDAPVVDALPAFGEEDLETLDERLGDCPRRLEASSSFVFRLDILSFNCLASDSFSPALE